MRWPWNRHPEPDDGEAESAARKAEGKLAEARGKQAEISEVARQLRELRREPLAEMINKAMRPPPRPTDGR